MSSKHNNQRIFRVKKEPGEWFMLHKRIINDARLSWKAKGILIYLLSKPDDWVCRMADIEQHATDGRDACASGIRELEQVGYIRRAQTRTETGEFGPPEWVVYEWPPTVNGKPVNGKTVNGKPATTNNDLTNNDDDLNGIGAKPKNKPKNQPPAQQEQYTPAEQHALQLLKRIHGAFANLKWSGADNARLVRVVADTSPEATSAAVDWLLTKDDWRNAAHMLAALETQAQRYGSQPEIRRVSLAEQLRQNGYTR